MGGFSIWHWMIVLLVVIMVFGTKKLRNIGGDLGSAVKGFKEGMKNDEDTTAQLKEEDKIIEGEVKSKTHTNA